MTSRVSGGEPAAERSVARRAKRAIVAVATSAGGLKALRVVLGALPADFPAPLVVVQHLDPHRETAIVRLLTEYTPLRVKLAEHGERVLPGTVYVAPPDRHLLVTPEGELLLSDEGRVRFERPSADVLFESVATAFTDRAVAVVLTGSASDAAAGVRAIHAHGGTVVVQDPASAEFTGMPQAAIHTGVVDGVVPLEGVGPALADLFREGPEG